MKLQITKKSMPKNKIISIIFIIFIFTVFTVFEYRRKSEFKVLNVITADKIQVDLNSNKIADSGETICLENVKTFTSNLEFNQDELAEKLNISNEEALKFGYLTDNFVRNILADKDVKLKLSGEQNQNCRFADIIVDNQSYTEKLLNTGLGFRNGKPVNYQNYMKNLEKVRKYKLVILNHKSSKYHNLNCKYGLIAHDAIVIMRKEIPEDAKPCKFCHITKQDKTKKLHKKSAQTYPLAISNGSLKIYLSDLTTKLKPDRRCSSLACKEILNQINNSKNSIDIALYGWESIPEIKSALLNAKSRGVKISLVYDTSSNPYYSDMKSIITLADKSSTDTPKILMHNKFMIFDNSKVITGSMNFARTGFSGFNSDCVIFLNSTEIAKIYKEEFTQMLSGKFHNEKSNVNHKTVILGNTKVTPLFSPKDKIITNSIVPLINNAKQYIYIPAFLITHDELASSLISAKERGVNVKIIIDATNTYAARSKVKMLRSAGIPVKIENYAGKLHSKSIIIDDKYIIAGSMNFSRSGENKNDENALIIEDKRLARHYKGFFEYLWKKIPDKYLKQGVRAEGKYSIGSCTDGIDNNFDGKIDSEDAGCKN